MSDGFEMLFTEEHEQRVLKYHDEAVLEALKKKLEKKRDQVRWKKNKHGLRPRFHKIVAGDQFAEMSFKAKRRQYRAVFIILERVKALVFVRAVKKQDKGAYTHSPQHKLLDTLEKKQGEIRERALDVVSECRD